MRKHRSSLFLGLIAGTVLALLFAPEKGKKLREKIKAERKEGGCGCVHVKDSFLGMFREIGQSVQSGIAKSEDLQAAIEIGRDKLVKVAQEKKQQLNQLLEDARGKFEEIRDLVTEEGQKMAKKGGKTAQKAARKVKKGVTKAKRTVKKAQTQARKVKRQATSKAKAIKKDLEAKKKIASDVISEIKDNLK